MGFPSAHASIQKQSPVGLRWQGFFLEAGGGSVYRNLARIPLLRSRIRCVRLAVNTPKKYTKTVLKFEVLEERGSRLEMIMSARESNYYLSSFHTRHIRTSNSILVNILSSTSVYNN
jgi:hypothetical protein